MKQKIRAQRGQTVRYVGSLLLYGTNGVAARFLHLGSMQVVLLRTFFGWLVLTLAWIFGRRARQRAGRREIFFVLLSGVCMAADWLFLFEAYARIGVGLGMVLNYCGPVFVMLASAVFFREKMGAISWCALGVSLLGAVLISFEAAGTVDAVGLLCAAVSALCYAAMVLTNRQAVSFSGLSRVVVQMTGALGTVALYALLRGGLLFRVPAGSWGTALWLGVCSTGLGSYLYFSSIPRLPVREVSVLGYVEPLSALVFSAVLLGERMRPAQMLGAGLILGGTLGMELLRKRD